MVKCKRWRDDPRVRKHVETLQRWTADQGPALEELQEARNERLRLDAEILAFEARARSGEVGLTGLAALRRRVAEAVAREERAEQRLDEIIGALDSDARKRMDIEVTAAITESARDLSALQQATHRKVAEALRGALPALVDAEAITRIADGEFDGGHPLGLRVLRGAREFAPFTPGPPRHVIVGLADWLRQIGDLSDAEFDEVVGRLSAVPR